MDELQRLHRTEVLRGANADVTAQRERGRLRRLRRLTVFIWVVCLWLVYRTVFAESLLPHISFSEQYGPSFLIVGLLAMVLLLPMLGAGRSPHVLYRPDELDVGLDDVVGSDVVREE